MAIKKNNNNINKAKPHHIQEARERCALQNSYFKIMIFKKLYRMWNGGEKNVSCGLCRHRSCSSLKLLFTPSGLLSSRKFFQQNSAFNPLSSCPGPLGPLPPHPQWQPALAELWKGGAVVKVNEVRAGGKLTKPRNQIKHWSVTKVYSLKRPQISLFFPVTIMPD